MVEVTNFFVAAADGSARVAVGEDVAALEASGLGCGASFCVHVWVLPLPVVEVKNLILKELGLVLEEGESHGGAGAISGVFLYHDYTGRVKGVEWIRCFRGFFAAALTRPCSCAGSGCWRREGLE